MAHILAVDYSPEIPNMLADVLGIDGHWVTCAGDLWQMLSTARATLHPMIVMFNRSVSFIRPSEDTDEHPVTIMRRYEADLRRHRWIELSSRPEMHPEEIRIFFERLGVHYLRMPFTIDTLLEQVTRVAQELDPPS